MTAVLAAAAELQGALWYHFGFAPYTATHSSCYRTCMCEGGGFDVDPFAELESGFRGSLPPAGDLVSLGLWVSWRRGALQRMSLKLGGERLELAPVTRWQAGRLFLSPRRRLAAPPPEVVLEIDPESAPPERVELRLYRWAAE